MDNIMYTPLVSEYRFDPSEDPKSATFDLMHHGYVCIVDENSNVLYSAGDCDDLVFYRSASKPIRSSGLRKKNRWFCPHPILDARVMWKQWRAF